MDGRPPPRRVPTRWTYKVVFPGGVKIRPAPDTEAEEAGEEMVVMPCGEVFEAGTVLALNGRNWVKLSDGRGWVFEALPNEATPGENETQVLELINCGVELEDLVLVGEADDCHRGLGVVCSQDLGQLLRELLVGELQLLAWLDHDFSRLPVAGSRHETLVLLKPYIAHHTMHHHTTERRLKYLPQKKSSILYYSLVSYFSTMV